MLKFIVLRKILNWSLVVFCCMRLTVKGLDSKDIESLSMKDLKQELSMAAKRKSELKDYYVSSKEKELQEKTKAFEVKVGMLVQESAKKKDVDGELDKVRGRVEGLYGSLSRKTKEFWDRLKGVESKTATKEDLLAIKNEVHVQAKAFEGKVGMLAQESAKKKDVDGEFDKVRGKVEGVYAVLSSKTKEFWDRLKGVESKTATKEDLLALKNEAHAQTKAFEGKVAMLAQESAKKKDVDGELDKVRGRVEGLYGSLSRKTKEFWDRLKGVESKTATKEDLLAIKNEVHVQAKAFEGKVGMLAQESIVAAKKTEVSKQFKELEKRINLLSMTIDRYKNDSNISGEFEKRLGIYGNDLRSLNDDLSTVLGKIDDFNKFKLSRASKTEVEDKVAEVREKLDLLSGDLHNYMKEMNSDISKTIDKKLTTTENLIRSDVDSKFNHLQRQLDFIKGQMAQSNIPLNVKSVGTTSNSTDTTLRKDEISRLIKSAVKRHMHLAQENLRPKKEYHEELPVRVRRPRYRSAPVYEEDYYD